MAGRKNQAAQTAEMLAAASGLTGSTPTAVAVDGIDNAAGAAAGASDSAHGGTTIELPPVGVPGVAVSGDVSASAVSAALAATEPAFVTAADGSWALGANGTLAIGGQGPAPVQVFSADSLRMVDSDGTVLREYGSDAADLPAAPAPVQRQLLARVLVDGRYGKVNDVVRVTADELQASAGELCGHPASVAYAKSL
ncbi:hypothetical protein [Cupriavidus plantarum]|uniref:hypothetical protein n=1 Tax=Cupriavidus plantarum TaxID=942865 RepID=UPI000F1963C0|nr:hypothetical protein [Cupriavidus plantarum]RLK45952.1 hypothetical protein C7417_1983 [Cupriavidus plantarum]